MRRLSYLSYNFHGAPVGADARNVRRTRRASSPKAIIDALDRVVTDPKQALRDAVRANLTPKGARVVDPLIELFND